MAPEHSVKPYLALCDVGAQWRERHVSSGPHPHSSFLYCSDTRVKEGKNEGERGLSHQVAKGGISWHLLPSLKKFKILCSVLHETKLKSGQGWAQSLESSVDRNFITFSKPPHLSPTPRIVFSLGVPFYIPKVPEEEQDVPL